MKLDWGNGLLFNNANEYYETLGFLSKDEYYVRVYTEDNKKSGAWGKQGRMSLYNREMKDQLPRPLVDVFPEGDDTRISATDYVNNLIENHFFTKEEDPTGNGYVKTMYKESIGKVLSTVPDEYLKDFNRGYHKNYEISKRIKSESSSEINWGEESNIDEEIERKEGKKKGYYTTKYERNPQNRKEAVRIHGTKCMICGFDFEQKYGEIGKDYIEVHHIIPLSEREEEVVIDPEKDLICVCANCHRMLHRFKNYIISIEELKQMIDDNK